MFISQILDEERWIPRQVNVSLLVMVKQKRLEVYGLKNSLFIISRDVVCDENFLYYGATSKGEGSKVLNPDFQSFPLQLLL